MSDKRTLPFSEAWALMRKHGGTMSFSLKRGAIATINKVGAFRIKSDEPTAEKASKR